MDINRMLAELKQERDSIEQAILTLEHLARGRGRRRGRPPAWMSALKKKEEPREAKPRSKAKES